jgi:hypothetical protein
MITDGRGLLIQTVLMHCDHVRIPCNVCVYVLASVWFHSGNEEGNGLTVHQACWPNSDVTLFRSWNRCEQTWNLSCTLTGQHCWLTGHFERICRQANNLCASNETPYVTWFTVKQHFHWSVSLFLCYYQARVSNLNVHQVTWSDQQIWKSIKCR